MVTMKRVQKGPWRLRLGLIQGWWVGGEAQQHRDIFYTASLHQREGKMQDQPDTPGAQTPVSGDPRRSWGSGTFSPAPFPSKYSETRGVLWGCVNPSSLRLWATREDSSHCHKVCMPQISAPGLTSRPLGVGREVPWELYRPSAGGWQVQDPAAPAAGPVTESQALHLTEVK